METSTLNTLISGAAGIAGSLFNIGSQSSVNETNLQIARENRDFYYEQWQRENQYNDPSAVMQRLSRAGLNPNLMYGEGTGGLAASATMQNVDPGRVAAPTVDPYLMAQIGLMNAQKEKTEKETEKTESDIRVNDGIIKLNESTTLYNAALTSFTKSQQDHVIAQMEMLDDTRRQIQSVIDLNYATMSHMSEQDAVAWYDAFTNSDKVQAEIDKLASERAWIDEQKKYYAALVASQIADNRASAAYKLAQEKLAKAEEALAKANEELAGKRKSEVEATTTGIKINNQRLQIQLDLDNAGYAATERELEQLRVASEVYRNAASSMDNINGVINVPGDIKSAATNASNRAANRTGSRKGQ